MKLLIYLKNTLQFPLGEWKELDEDTKTWYKNAAREEMNTLGIEVSE